jgi:hypothetical protein
MERQQLSGSPVVSAQVPDRLQDKAKFRKPHRCSGGFEPVLVNNVVVVEDGKIRGARPGKVIRRWETIE